MDYVTKVDVFIVMSTSMRAHARCRPQRHVNHLFHHRPRPLLSIVQCQYSAFVSADEAPHKESTL